ncbi:hypothetical protein OOU_Y34scaffold00590g106 [Pyricularia oryzae Y34]|uniref:Uncharacterized protein n=2 Tax=Pyricularia oryzae TaxID=318829 RepID=A0AA97PK23_PYRO3|nr:hypothetical protein OOU_Y34scaffold00590g106 [Pyricularia oryzae Y34]
MKLWTVFRAHVCHHLYHSWWSSRPGPPLR